MDKYQEAYRILEESHTQMLNQTSQVIQYLVMHSIDCEKTLKDCRALLINNPEAQAIVARIDELLTDPYQKKES
jgi:hypothetical protein